MNNETLSNFKESLTLHHDALLEWFNLDPDHQTVNLGTGDIKDVLKVVSDLKNTLERIDNGTFGLCKDCDGKVETDLLELDYSSQVCLDHYTESQRRALENDLELAAKVQKQLLPCCIPSHPGLQIATHTVSARIVSGDYYDFFVSKNGLQGLILADVMGKGLPASMLMANLQASLRILGPRYEELHPLVVRLNELFRNNLKLIKFISIFLALIDLDKSILKFCSAGHHPAIWLEAQSESIHLLKPTGPAIGLIKHAEFISEEVPVHSGDLFVLYTDGLVEASNVKNEEFGEDRLADLIKKNGNNTADEVMKSLLDTVKNFAGQFDDDVTMMVIKIL